MIGNQTDKLIKDMTGKHCGTVVFKIEFETLCSDDGKVCNARMEHLAMLCSNMRNSGLNVLLVSSGAIALGACSLNMPSMPIGITAKQATAAVGQAELIMLYQDCFDRFGQTVAQVLLTCDAAEDPVRKTNARNTLARLLQKGIIPVINENDSVSTTDIILNDNYPLALVASELTEADAIVITTSDPDNLIVFIKGYPSVITAGTGELIELTGLLDKGEYDHFIGTGGFPGYNEYAGATIN